MRTKKFLAMAIALGLAVGMTAMPTLAAEKKQDDFVVQNTLTQSFLDLFFSQFFTTEEFFHQLFAGAL